MSLSAFVSEYPAISKRLSTDATLKYGGTEVTVKNRYALGGPVLLRVEGAYDLALGKDIARQITVKDARTHEQ